MSDLDEFRTKSLARQSQAEEALILGDPEPRMKLWSRRDPVTLFSAGGQCKSPSANGCISVLGKKEGSLSG